MTLRVAEVGGDVRLVAGCRFGLRHFGVPPGGWCDPDSARLARALLGHATAGPTLELTMASLDVEVREPGAVAFVGGGHEVWVDSQSVPTGSAVAVGSGSRIRVRPARWGLRLAIATDPGLASGPVGSIEPGAEFATEGPSAGRRFAQRVKPWWIGDGVLDLPYLAATPPGFEVEATVGTMISREGVRLSAGSNLPVGERTGLSRPITPGTIQVPDARSLIVIGPDGPTIGGYEPLGFLPAFSRARLSQAPPGTEVVLRPCAHERAAALEEEESRKVLSLIRRLSAKSL
ncbi:MAG: hypothetical protein KIT11_10105 [Fimbriimonadaceae bacterium]|nr:hypothetical protein [Fimbriimonadaceae bacterium]QYK55676.1 MAG: hypothetical protein KF733_11775 [Fimbriimonadaceae bacterium]